jgi:opacity protein-like surface antigen
LGAKNGTEEKYMNKLALMCAVLLIFAGVASAQDNPRFEAFAGYSYLHVNPGSGESSESFNGGTGSLAYNFTPMFAVVADFGGYHFNGPAAGGNLDAALVTYLFGPKVSLHHGPITPFAQALLGGAHGGFTQTICGDARVRSQGGNGGCESGSISDNGFSLAVGGGLDWNATSHISIRLIQAEYLMTQFFSQTQNNARISTGLVFRW